MRVRAAVSVFLSGMLFAVAWMSAWTGPPVAMSQPASGTALLAAVSSASDSAASSAFPASEPQKANTRAQRAVDKLANTIEGYGGTLGAYVVDIASGEVLAVHNPTTALNPASNMKLVTAASALWKLSAQHTYRTALYGRRDGTSVGDLVLRGYGDPSFSAKDLWELANSLRRWGIKRVKGDILVDQSFFDKVFVPPGFEQQPDEWAYFRAPVSAVALDSNTVTMHVAPVRKGEPALVTFAPPGFVDVTGRVMSGSGGSTQSVTLSLAPTEGRLKAQVGGTIPEDASRLRVTQRVDDPTLYAGFALRAMLAEQGVQLDGQVRAGGENASSMLAMHRSERLANLLERVGKESDNFYAEMIFKSLAGATIRRGLSSQSGAEVATAYLKSIGAFDDGVQLLNGSGLFDTNRVTARSIGVLLRAAYQDPEMRTEFVRHLAIGGEDGTLRSRFRDRGLKGRVRAKTGTLSSVTSLSGYVLVEGEGSPIGFSVLVNGVAGKTPGARQAIDDCIRAIVRDRRDN